MAAKLIYAFDVGRYCGVAYGRADEPPASETWTLKKRNEPPAVAGWSLIVSLRARWRTAAPDLVVKESAPTFEAMRRMQNGQDSMMATATYHAIIESLCHGHTVPIFNVWPSTWRKHFIGRAHAGQRHATKRAVVLRCRQLKLVEPDCVDEDRCDALGIWDYGANAIARAATVAGRDLRLFDEGTFQ